MVLTSRIGIALGTALLALAMTGEAKAQGFGPMATARPITAAGSATGTAIAGVTATTAAISHGPQMYYVPQTYNNLNGLAGMIGRTVAPRSTTTYGTPTYRRRR